jgi:hypothetical protein
MMPIVSHLRKLRSTTSEMLKKSPKNGSVLTRDLKSDIAHLNSIQKSKVLTVLKNAGLLALLSLERLFKLLTSTLLK